MNKHCWQCYQHHPKTRGLNKGLHISVWKTSWWVCSLHHVKEPLWFWDLQKRTALFKFRKNLEGDLGEHRQPLLRSGTISRSIVMKELAKIFVNKDQAGQEQRCAFLQISEPFKALWRGVNCTPTMMSSKLINEDPCSNHGLLDGVGNIINNVFSLKHVKHDKDEFIRYNNIVHNK